MCLTRKEVKFMNKVSIVVPCYNEEESLDLFYEEISITYHIGNIGF